MANQFKVTTADLIESVVDRSHVPTNQETFPPERLLRLATEEMWTRLVPLVLSTQEDYYVTYQDYDGGEVSYTLPSRAIAGKLKDLVLVNSLGEERSVARVSPSQRQYHSGEAFFLRADQIVFLEAPSDTVRAYFHIRPNYLVETTECGRITSVGVSSIEIDSAPSTFVDTATFDIVQSAGARKLVAMNQSVTIVGTTVTFTTLPEGIAVGDYLCLAGESPVVQLPFELIPVLAQRVAEKAMEADGDREGSNAAKKELLDMERSALLMLEPRVDDEPKKVINPHSAARRSHNRYR